MVPRIVPSRRLVVILIHQVTPTFLPKVERIIKTLDTVILLVDSAEATNAFKHVLFYVLINKSDKAEARVG